MKHFWFVLMCQATATVLACVATGLLQNASTAWFVAGVALAVATVVAFSFLNATVVRHALQQIETGLTNKASSNAVPWMPLEFAVVRDKTCEQTHRWSKALGHQRQQLQHFSGILERLDRRTDVRGQSSSELANSLQLVLTGLAAQLGSELKAIDRENISIRKLGAEIGHSSEHQLEALGRATSCIDQLSARLQPLSQSAERTLDELNSWTSTVERVRGRHDGTLSAAERLRVQLDHSERRLRSLSERTQDIGSAIETIGSISDRTDLLSLNASIESFRSGDQGRGFSFVAEEVRRLAEQAAHVSREVGTLLQNIQSESHDVIRSLTDQQDLIAQIQETMRQADGDLGNVTQRLEHAAEQQQTIQHQALLQIEGIESLVSLMEEIASESRNQRRAIEATSWNLESIQRAVATAGNDVRRLNDEPVSATDALEETTPDGEAQQLLETIAEDSRREPVTTGTEGRS